MLCVEANAKDQVCGLLLSFQAQGFHTSRAQLLISGINWDLKHRLGFDSYIFRRTDGSLG